MHAASFDRAKQEGDAAMQRQAFKEAEQCYAQALICRSDAAVFCNRAFARLRLERWQAAEEDATAALQFDLEEKLRIKALFRRGLAREALGHLQAASDDLNAALRAAPGNASISESARRIYSKLPRLSQKWVPGQPFHSSAVEALASAIPGSVVGYLWTQSHPCIRFPNHMAVQAHERTQTEVRGTLHAECLPELRHKEVATKKHDFCEPAAQTQVEYDVGGNLAKMYSKFAEAPGEGQAATNGGSGELVHEGLRETCVYKAAQPGGEQAQAGVLACGMNGRFNCTVPFWIPEGQTFRRLVVPVKKALGIGLAPNEEELCIQHGVAWEAVPPAELSFARPDVETPMAFRATPGKVVEKMQQAVAEPAAFTPSDCFQGLNCLTDELGNAQ
ncbi:Translocon at the outer membrane of chloroplasts 64 [Symbiodinium microadriaticum]|uniref:Translocon at the outer membrane of chloroplasts 64 n=1 Tax=Symbiodinium microadriaticum TaxID=2951 RepID=A0A1Q9DUD2_SYMMI|nr:Translocon at the outer membrane of chloroplasts 64 [Symbiodinium microadriaticum]